MGEFGADVSKVAPLGHECRPELTGEELRPSKDALSVPRGMMLALVWSVVMWLLLIHFVLYAASP